jgi:hypothetical protein
VRLSKPDCSAKAAASGSAQEDFVERKRDQCRTGQAFYRAGHRFEQVRAAFDKSHQAFAQQPANRLPGRRARSQKLMTNA